ncbi:glycosyltransferase family 2 protein [Coleophoma crateriformis]|uniref:Glycosyltransferase family 2 protein n=1 Tax=Coleophoma crateriformis TaxID=565419 RepID=A0A3D8SNQ6_9HELO|nr:glycosyltransferase family 2 protein [Coleophoma crateriformis]
MDILAIASGLVGWTIGWIPYLIGWEWVWVIMWAHRYVRLVVNCISHWTYKTVPIPESPSYESKDVTVIIPTIHNDFAELTDSLQSILACRPYELLLVTTTDKYDGLMKFVKTLEAPNVRVFQVPIANKRIQVCEAIPLVKTEITIMADDDVTWPRTILPWLLAPFEDKKIGGVGPCQRVKRIRAGHPISARMYNWLGAAYIERRNFEISATHGMDGGTSCMSGRTCAFRSEILQSPLFLHGFKTERWGRFQLNADDDNFVTRWLVSNQWKTWIQYNKECEIETTLENNSLFLNQCLRWARSNWRSNWTSLVTERHVWRQQPWSTYALHIATFTSLAFLLDPAILWVTYQATQTWSPEAQRTAMLVQFLFMCASKVVKLVGLFVREPSDILFLPVSILFGYFHGLIKLWALFTLRVTSWGSRADGDANDSARMTPRARRSESITLPPGNHPGLIQFNNDKSFMVEKGFETDSTVVVDEALDSSEDDSRSSSDDAYDSHDSMSVENDDVDTQGR